MNYEEVKAGVLNLDPEDQKRFVMEILPDMLTRICNDDACLDTIRRLLDEETIRTYREEHMDGI